MVEDIGRDAGRSSPLTYATIILLAVSLTILPESADSANHGRRCAVRL